MKASSCGRSLSPSLRTVALAVARVRLLEVHRSLSRDGARCPGCRMFLEASESRVRHDAAEFARRSSSFARLFFVVEHFAVTD